MFKRIEVNKGDTYNDLTVIKEVESEKKGRHVSCECKCGEIQTFALRNIRSGNSQRCRKCSNKSMIKNRGLKVNSGDRFGSWTVIKELEPKGRNRVMECICDCGTVKIMYLHILRCGTSKMCSKCSNNQPVNVQLKINQGDCYGDRIVIRETDRKVGKNGREHRAFECVCKCGRVESVLLDNLINGKKCKECRNKEFIERTKNNFRNYRKSQGLDPDTPISNRTKLERDIFAKIIRTKIFSRDNNKCQMCFQRADNIHHIIPWSACYKKEDQQLRYDPENCIAICKDCHLKAHGGDYHKVDDEIAEQLLAKAIENTEKNYEHMKGLKEEALRKLAEII